MARRSIVWYPDVHFADVVSLRSTHSCLRHVHELNRRHCITQTSSTLRRIPPPALRVSTASDLLGTNISFAAQLEFSYGTSSSALFFSISLARFSLLTSNFTAVTSGISLSISSWPLTHWFRLPPPSSCWATGRSCLSSILDVVC